LLRRGEHALPFGGNEARSDDDGRFELRGLSAGEYVLEFGRPGAAVAGEVELELHQDQPEHEQNVMIPGASVSLRAIEATGSVGVEGARVALTKVRRIPGGGSERTTRTQSKVMVVGLTSGAGGGSSTFTMTSGSKGVKTDTQGHATVLDLPAGRYQLELTHKRFMRFRKEIEVSKGQALQVGTIKLAQGCSIRGRIKWEVLPAVPTALVQLTDGEGAVQPNGVKVVEGNRFAFAGLRPGLYRVRVRSVLETEWVESDPVQLVVGKTERVNMTMPSKK